MRVGVFLLSGRFPGQTDEVALGRTIRAIDAAEQSGFDEAWIAEHHFVPYSVSSSAITVAAYALGRTSRLVVGTGVSVLSTAHPVDLAERSALLDQLSGGRFRLGVGRGSPLVDLEVFGTGLDRWGRDGFAEGLDLLLRALTQPRVAHDSDRFRFREVPVVPRPATRPHPPVVVACTSEETVGLAAARCLPMLLGMDLDDSEKLAMVERYRACGGPPPATSHIATVVAHVADSRRAARRTLLQTMPPWLEAGFRAPIRIDGRPASTTDPRAYAERLCDLHPVGSPEDCIARIRAGVDRTGIDHVLMMVEGSGDTEATVENIRCLGAEVLPALQPVDHGRGQVGDGRRLVGGAVADDVEGHEDAAVHHVEGEGDRHD